ncbi:lysozyme [Aurantiacibacter sp. MUD11]|uniref:lysozyme n=1 Tax=Aurantiacibacter sp. MUD11 TaxID=3003265 RepID=UPI0022AA2F2D|nr:lysozyme [Aurantiacibacter sp. MUD11]WAT17994.1 lysozyme [Aurantiacibacter sp. MUD11]
MRGQMVREFVMKMRTRRKARQHGTPRRRMRRRKAALAMSAAVMGLSTGAQVMPADQRQHLTLAAPDASTTRVNARHIRASETLKEALAEEEGVRLTVYRDAAGYPTVGVGHLVQPEDRLSVGDRISYDRALDFLEQDLATAEAAVRRLVGALPLFQHEFDALVDLVYNVGEGNVAPDQSPQLNDAIGSGDYDRIAEELHYSHAAGRYARGLRFRSERRQSIFMDAAYDDPRAVELGPDGRAAV